jgi:hypothetical protein
MQQQPKKQAACPAGCDDGTDWGSGEAEICEECEGAGSLYVTQPPIYNENKSYD